MGDPAWAELLSLANVVLSGLLAWYSLVQARQAVGFGRVLLLVMTIIGLYWCGLYVWVFITPAASINSTVFGQVSVRPVFTFTLAAMLSMAVYRYYRGRHG